MIYQTQSRFVLLADRNELRLQETASDSGHDEKKVPETLCSKQIYFCI